MKILFVNACVRKESRTLVLAKDILSKMQGDITEIDLAKEKLAPLNCMSLEERERLLKSKEIDAPIFQYAKNSSKWFGHTFGFVNGKWTLVIYKI